MERFLARNTGRTGPLERPGVLNQCETLLPFVFHIKSVWRAKLGAPKIETPYFTYRFPLSPGPVRFDLTAGFLKRGYSILPRAVGGVCCTLN